MLTPDWLGAFSALATLVVVAIGTVAALRQMRHMRSANQLAALYKIYDVMEAPEFREAVTFVTRDFPSLVEDSQARRELMTSGSIPHKYRQIVRVANHYEQVGLLCKRHYLDINLVADMNGNRILRAWGALADFVVSKRISSGSSTAWENFEYLARECQRFKKRHPNGAYPKHAQRMPGNAWPESRPLT